jgi:hypothetical protein
VVGMSVPDRGGGGVSDEPSVVVVSVPDVVVSLGLPISVVDSGTLVVNVVEVSDGVMTNVCLSRVSVGADCVVTGVVNTVVSGLLHSPDICTTVYTRAAMSAAPTPPAVKVAAGVRYQALLPGSLSGATCADPSPARFARTLDDR